MNIFNKVTLQSLKKNRTRTIVTIIGVILSAAMITGVTTFISSFQNLLIKSEIARFGDWHVEFIDTDYDFMQERLADKELNKSAVVQNIGYAVFESGNNLNAKPYLFIMGFGEEAFDTLPIKLLSGRLPQDDGEIIISEHINTTGGVSYKIGDVLTLSVGIRMFDGYIRNQNSGIIMDEDGSQLESFTPITTKTYTVVGIIARPAFENYSAPGYTLITRMDSQTDDKTTSYNILASLKSPRDVYGYAARTASGSYNFNNGLLRFMGISNHDNFNTVLYSLGGILIALIMVGSILLIYNSFAISVSERSRQFGILSSVGATSKQLRKSVLFEGVCVGIIGIPIGILAGICGIGVTLELVGGIFEEMSAGGVALTLTVSIPAVVIAAAVAVMTILLSAYIPARRASKRSAIDSIRQIGDIKIKAKVLKTSRLTRKLFGLEGTLALKNFRRNKKRYRSTVISLFVSVVLFISAGAFGMYLQKGVEGSVGDYGYDLTFVSNYMEFEETINLYGKLKNVSDVYESGYFVSASFDGGRIPAELFSSRYREYLGYMKYDDSEDFNETIGSGGILVFIDDETHLRYIRDLKLPVNEYTGKNAKLVAVAKVQEYDYKNKRFVSFDMFAGKDLSLQMSSSEDLKNTKNIAVTFAAQMPPAISATRYTGFILFAPYSMLNELNFNTEDLGTLTLTFLSDNPMNSASEMETVISGAGIVSGYTLTNVAQMMESKRRIILVINVFTYGFVVLISLIATANVFNTVSTSINLRRREFAMLRSVGMTDGGFNGMVNYECIFYGLKALLYGLPTALIITYFIYKAVTAGADVAFTMPWSSIGISVFSVFSVVFVTMMYSLGKIKKANVIDALRDEIS